MFVVILEAPAASRAEVAAGLDGVRDILLRGAWAGAAETLAPADLADLLDGLDDPATWRMHGVGDGRPYWRWHAPLGAGTISVQRLTVPLPAQLRATGAMREAAAALDGCAAALRRLIGAPTPSRGGTGAG